MVVSVAAGELTPAMLTLHDRSVIADPRYNPLFGLLFDVRRVTDFRIPLPGLRDQIDTIRRYSCVAIVAPTDLGFGLARVYQAYVPQGEDGFKVFRGGTDAWDWLSEQMRLCN
jgi:hypothetical protein